jgi:hypothetical protein
MRKSSQHLIPESETLPRVDVGEDPKRPYAAAVRALASRLNPTGTEPIIGGQATTVEALFDDVGHVRSLTTDSAQGLFTEQFTGTPREHARKFLDTTEVANALGLRHVDLEDAGEHEVPGLGTTVAFKQVAKIGTQTVRVRNGFVHVYLDTQGRVYNVNSTLRNGRKRGDYGKLITQDAALAAAKASFGGSQAFVTEKVELVLSSHNGRLDPVYEVKLGTDEPRKLALFLVRAASGIVVYRTNLLRATSHGGNADAASAPGGDTSVLAVQAAQAANAQVKGRALLRIPDPKVGISKQVHDVIMESLPDPTVLKNHNCTMYVGKTKKEVRAKADGTFNYSPDEPEFLAVVTFFAFHIQMELMKKWGMKANTKPIPIFVHDPSVRDNAYFDPEAYEIHIGVGSGLPAGLAKFIAYDLGVTWHENGHHVVFLQTPGNDLPGSEGGAQHEAVGDMQDLLMDFWFRLVFGPQLGHTLTADDVAKDPLIIGLFAAAPGGIRVQKNNKQTPRDKTGEVHDDGEIVGGAMADVLVAMATASGTTLKTELENFGKLLLGALALVPAHKVTFVDLLKAFLTADQQLFKGAYKQMITDGFKKHGIKTATTSGGARVPVIIIRPFSNAA